MYELNALIISESGYNTTVWMANLSAALYQIHINCLFSENYCQWLCILQYCPVARRVLQRAPYTLSQTELNILWHSVDFPSGLSVLVSALRRSHRGVGR
jgi:hypothetical protein